MGVLAWIRGRSAPTDELAAQLDAAVLEQAAASQALLAAQHAFDDLGDEKSSKTLLSATERLNLADAHVARANKLLAERRATEEKARLDALKAQIVVLEEKMWEALALEDPLIEREAALLKELLKLRIDRWQRRMDSNKWVRDINSLELEMTGKASTPMIDGLPRHEPVVKLLQSTTRFWGTGDGMDPRVALFSRIVPDDKTYLTNIHFGLGVTRVKNWADLDPNIDVPANDDAA